MSITFHDRAIINGPSRITPEGHFVAKARVARANNVQDYAPHELSMPPKADGSPYRIFRPESAVFAKDSLASALHRPIVIGHPKEDVTATNWKALTVGDTGSEIMRDGDTMIVPIMVMDAQGVEAVQTTHREFSWGYAADLTMTPGRFGDTAYDGSITPPRYNHLAMCPNARGGADLRITDERPSHLRTGGARSLRDAAGHPVTLCDAATGGTMKLNADLISAIENEADKLSMSVHEYVQNVLKYSWAGAKLSGVHNASSPSTEEVEQ